MKQQYQGTIFFPIEIVNREYPGHILLATLLASLGLRVVIGHRESVNKIVGKAKNPGIIFFKGDDELRHLDSRYNRRPHIFVGQDPEAGIADESFVNFYNERPLLHRLQTASAYFAFGLDDYEFLRGRYVSGDAQIFNYGSPRTFLWGQDAASFFQPQIDQIRNHFKDFVLLTDSYFMPDVMSYARSLRDSTGLDVVLRPHPASDARKYFKDARYTPGIHVVTAFELIPWLRTAYATVSSGSTTSLEGWVANTPVVSDPTVMPTRGATPRLIVDRIALQPQHGETIGDGVMSAPQRWDHHRGQKELRDLVSRKVHPTSKSDIVAMANVIVKSATEEMAGSPQASSQWRAYLQLRDAFTKSDDKRFAGRLPPKRGGIKRPVIAMARVHRDVTWTCQTFGVGPVDVTRAGLNCFTLTKE